MKKIFFSTLSCLLLITSFLSSCEQSDESDDYFMVFHDGDEIVVNLPPAIDSIYMVDSVLYYWDGVYIATERDFPFVHIIQLVNQKLGQHRCDVCIYYHRADLWCKRSVYYTYDVR